jgi:hypothetical protein
VNTSSWMPQSDVEYFNIFAGIDTAIPPPPPGLDVVTIKAIWMQIRTDWSRLVNALFSATGASTTSCQEIHRIVYEKFICGSRLSFVHKIPTMYVFMLWFQTKQWLPPCCIRILTESAALNFGLCACRESNGSPKKGRGPVSSRQDPQTDHNASLDSLVRLLTSKFQGNAMQTSDFETVRTAQMTNVEAQLRTLHAARAASAAIGKDTCKMDDAIEKMNEKLLDLVNGTD